MLFAVSSDTAGSSAEMSSALSGSRVGTSCPAAVCCTGGVLFGGRLFIADREDQLTQQQPNHPNADFDAVRGQDCDPADERAPEQRNSKADARRERPPADRKAVKDQRQQKDPAEEKQRRDQGIGDAGRISRVLRTCKDRLNILLDRLAVRIFGVHIKEIQEAVKKAVVNADQHEGLLI